MSRFLYYRHQNEVFHLLAKSHPIGCHPNLSQEYLANYKCLRLGRYVDSLSTTATGKIQKNRLGVPPLASTPSPDVLLQKFC